MSKFKHKSFINISVKLKTFYQSFSSLVKTVKSATDQGVINKDIILYFFKVP